MTKKKTPSGLGEDKATAANRRLLEKVQRFWSEEAMAEAVPLPIERDEEQGPSENGSGHPEEVAEKGED